MIWDQVVAPLLPWIQSMMICAGLLLLETLLVVIVGWVRHFSWPIRLIAPVPLAASVGASIGVLRTQASYLYWRQQAELILPCITSANQTGTLRLGIANAIHKATVFGWSIRIITGLLYVLGFLGVVLLVIGQRRAGPVLPASLAAQSQ